MRGDRRRFLIGSAAAGSLASLGDFSFVHGLPSVSAEEIGAVSDVVALSPDIEPLVRLIEQTPRERLLEEVGHRLRNGLGYRDLLAALLLAGVKNIEPRPNVGFKFHAVLVVNSAHLASLSSPPEHRWLPIFWALDYYKSAAERDVQERGDWTMRAIDDSALPPAHRAADLFRSAMDQWDEAAADVAAARLARSASATEVFEILWRYGARDYRSIGHKAIFVANSCRALECIGWRHAEPVLRSLAYGLLMHEGDNPAQRDAEADRPFRRNQQLVDQIRDDWRDGQIDNGAVEELLQTLRQGSPDDACDLVVQQLNRGVSPQSVWDGLLVCASECLMRQPGIIGLHAVTTSNALHYAYLASGNDQTRRLMVLQNAAFLPMFLNNMRDRGSVADASIGQLVAAEHVAAEPETLSGIFTTLNDNRQAAAQQTLGYLQAGGAATDLINAARLLVFAKGDDAHDYKFSSAVLEDYFHVSPAWRDAYLAANLFLLHGAKEQDNPLVQRTRAALE